MTMGESNQDDPARAASPERLEHLRQEARRIRAETSLVGLLIDAGLAFGGLAVTALGVSAGAPVPSVAGLAIAFASVVRAIRLLVDRQDKLDELHRLERELDELLDMLEE